MENRFSGTKSAFSNYNELNFILEQEINTQSTVNFAIKFYFFSFSVIFSIINSNTI
jgi:hypothetical protein